MPSQLCFPLVDPSGTIPLLFHLPVHLPLFFTQSKFSIHQKHFSLSLIFTHLASMEKKPHHNLGGL
jgi:hypothetical protein